MSCDSSEQMQMDSLPDLGRLYVVAALRRRKKPRPSTKRPELSAQIDDVAVDHDKLAEYRRICAIADDGTLPPTYPQVLATPLHAAIVAHANFPLPAMGLVHLENRIEASRPIADGERFNLRCAISGWEWDERLGIRFAIETIVTIAGEVVWKSELWALSRGDKDELVERERKHRDTPLPGEAPDPVVSRITDAPADLGRRYASMSKDYNPIHLYPLTAKPFGFRRPIIHGMWTMARCWAELADYAPKQNLEFSVRFLKPLYLPSKILISATKENGGLKYRCGTLQGDRLFLKGTIN